MGNTELQQSLNSDRIMKAYDNLLEACGIPLSTQTMLQGLNAEGQKAVTDTVGRVVKLACDTMLDEFQQQLNNTKVEIPDD
jgi:hypothetical protein